MSDVLHIGEVSFFAIVKVIAIAAAVIGAMAGFIFDGRSDKRLRAFAETSHGRFWLAIYFVVLTTGFLFFTADLLNPDYWKKPVNVFIYYVIPMIGIGIKIFATAILLYIDASWGQSKHD